MDNEQLLKPRYKVVADFPFNPFTIGQIIKMEVFGIPDNADIKEPCWQSEKIEKSTGVSTIWYEPFFIRYPHLFKELAWWEDRLPEEIPLYVRYGEWDKPHSIYKIVSLDLKENSAIAEIPTDYYLPFRYESFYPASEQEYIDFRKSKEQRIH
jgi:hypothetical protein